MFVDVWCWWWLNDIRTVVLVVSHTVVVSVDFRRLFVACDASFFTLSHCAFVRVFGCMTTTVQDRYKANKQEQNKQKNI